MAAFDSPKSLAEKANIGPQELASIIHRTLVQQSVIPLTFVALSSEPGFVAAIEKEYELPITDNLKSLMKNYALTYWSHLVLKYFLCQKPKISVE